MRRCRRRRLHRDRQPQALPQALQEHPDRQSPPAAGAADCGTIMNPNNSARHRRRKTTADQQPDPEQGLLESLEEQLKKLRKRKPYRIAKAISESTEQFITGRYDGPLDPGE